MISRFAARALRPSFASTRVSVRCGMLALAALAGCGNTQTPGDSPASAGAPSLAGAAGAVEAATSGASGVAEAGSANAAGGGASSGGAGAGASAGGAASDGGSMDSAGSPNASGGATPAAAGSGGVSAAAGSPSACPDLGGGAVTSTTQHLDIGIHDPSMIWSGTRYYLLGTSNRLDIRSSTNMQQWASAGSVFSAAPAWVSAAIGQNPGIWAPDVSYFNCAFHVYYAGSSFGSNNSVIGLATNPTLDTTSASYHWADQGQVLRSMTSDNYNAIDPNVAFDETGAPWLSFGSFWSGIKLRKLDANTGKPSEADTTLYSIAGRNGGAIEAPSIVSHNGFYYLFVSFDNCCKGVNSTYRTMMGRAAKITGPYSNKAGASMAQGAAEQMLATSGRYIGPGGGTAFRNGARYLYAFHYYDGNANGASKLQVRPIDFDADDWPTLGEPLFP